MTTPEPRFSVHHDLARHQWLVIDREGSRGQYAAVIGELDDRYPTSRNVIERYCRPLNEEVGRDERGPDGGTTETPVPQSAVPHNLAPPERARERGVIAGKNWPRDGAAGEISGERERQRAELPEHE